MDPKAKPWDDYPVLGPAVLLLTPKVQTQGTHNVAKKKLNIAIIGGGFMGRTHSNAFRQAPEFFKLDYEPVLKAVCTRSAEGAAKFADNWGFESSESDWRKLIERK